MIKDGIGQPIGPLGVYAGGVNNLNSIAGYHILGGTFTTAFIMKDGQRRDLPGQGAAGLCINDAEIVGGTYSEGETTGQPAYWLPGDSEPRLLPFDFGTNRPHGGRVSYITESGMMVGMVYPTTPEGFSTAPWLFTYTHGGEINLHRPPRYAHNFGREFVINGVTSDGTIFLSAYSYDSQFGGNRTEVQFLLKDGEFAEPSDLIVGLQPGESLLRLGTMGPGNLIVAGINTGNRVQGVLLEPVPEPGTLAALGLGVAAVLRKKRRA